MNGGRHFLWFSSKWCDNASEIAICTCRKISCSCCPYDVYVLPFVLVPCEWRIRSRRVFLTDCPKVLGYVLVTVRYAKSVGMAKVPCEVWSYNFRLNFTWYFYILKYNPWTYYKIRPQHKYVPSIDFEFRQKWSYFTWHFKHLEI